MVSDPVTVTPDTTLGEIRALAIEHGFHGFPVVAESGELVGIITGRDTRAEKDDSRLVSSIMTPKDKLITVKENAGSDEILGLMHQHRVEKSWS